MDLCENFKLEFFFYFVNKLNYSYLLIEISVYKKMSKIEESVLSSSSVNIAQQISETIVVVQAPKLT